MHVLMRQDDLRVAMRVAWSLKVVYLQVPVSLRLVNSKEKVLFRDDFFVLSFGQLLSCQLVLELELVNFFLDDLVNLLFNLLKVVGTGMSIEVDAGSARLLQFLQVAVLFFDLLVY